MRKTCPDCDTEKPAVEFPARGTGLATYCRPCQSARTQASQLRRYGSREAYNAHMRNYRRSPSGRMSWLRTRARRLGLSEVEVAKVVEAYTTHDGRCEVCDKQETERNLCIDHDHTRQTFRGLLCGECNSMLGLAHDNPQTLANGIKYLHEHR